MNIDRFIEVINGNKEFVGEEINFADKFIQKNASCKLEFAYNSIIITDEHGTIVFQIVHRDEVAIKFYDIIDMIKDIIRYEEDFGVTFNL